MASPPRLRPRPPGLRAGHGRPARGCAARRAGVLVAPLGPIEAEELRWYLEKYAVWPSRFSGTARKKVEENLVEWGQLPARGGDARRPGRAASCRPGRRSATAPGGAFSVHWSTPEPTPARPTPSRSRPRSRDAAARPAVGAAARRRGFLFQGARPVRVRRRLPNTRALEVPVLATPIRILLVTARPEDEACGYIDHRASALPLVGRWKRSARPGPVCTLLSPPTLPALRDELERAQGEPEKPYHVVHFDGHGVYDRGSASVACASSMPARTAAARQAPAPHRLHRRARPAAARPRHPARLPRSLPDRAGRAGVRIGRQRAAQDRRRRRWWR
jgi:hypothetical protein